MIQLNRDQTIQLIEFLSRVPLNGIGEARAAVALDTYLRVALDKERDDGKDTDVTGGQGWPNPSPP